MNEIIPAILALDKSDYQSKITQVKGLVNVVHLDLMDGIFVSQKSLAIGEIDQIDTSINHIAHLMTIDPASYFSQIISLGFFGVAVHLEVFNQQNDIINTIQEAKQHGLEVSIAIKPQTSADLLNTLIDRIDMVQIMTVNPGKTGQPVISSVKDKIEHIHQEYPNLPIAVDGGIKLDNIEDYYQVGARIFIIGSAIFNQEQPPNIQIGRFNNMIQRIKRPE